MPPFCRISTAAAVVSPDGEIRSSVVASQDELHARFGGVVPEVASRRHLELVTPVIEQALGEGLSAATDVWGLGVTLVESLTGELPHGDEATWDSRRRLWLLHRREPGRVGPIEGIPTEYDELLRACLERNPLDRPTLLDVRHVLTGLAP